MHRNYHFLILILAMLALAACGGRTPDATPTATSEAAPEPSPTLSPSATATNAPPLVYLVAPDGALKDSLQTLLSERTMQTGMRFQLRPSISTGDLNDDVRIVIALPPDPGIATLARSARDTDFLAVGIPGVETQENLSVISAAGISPDAMGFLAGYLAALITDDWRTGIVYRDDGSDEAYRAGFQNGVTYYCGLCSPVYPPFPSGGYPLMFSLAADPGPAEWSAVMGYFQIWGVETVFVTPQVASSGLFGVLGDEGINLIGQGGAPQGPAEYWVATIGTQQPFDAVQRAWEDLLAGNAGLEYRLEIELQQVNAELLSPGRQRLVEQTLADLQAGYIDTGYQPETAETP